MKKVLFVVALVVLGSGCHALDHSRAARHMKQGMSSYQAGKSTIALRDFSAAMEADPTFADPPYYMGLLYHQKLEQPDEAVKYYGIANEREPNNPQILYGLGSAYTDLKQFSQAEKAFADAVHVKPDFARAWFRLGNARLEQKDFSGAVDAFSSSIEADPTMMMSPDDPGGAAYHSLANLYEDFGLSQKALAVYEDAVHTNPKSIRLKVGLGVAALGAGEFEKAERSFADALEREPANGFALFNRGIALKELGRTDAAVRSFEDFVSFGGASKEQTRAAKTFIRQLKR